MQRRRQEAVGRPRYVDSGWNGGLDSSRRPHTRLHAAVERISSVPILDSSAHEPARQPVGYASSARKSRTRERGSAVLADLRERACTVITVDRMWFAEVSARFVLARKRNPRLSILVVFPSQKLSYLCFGVSVSRFFSRLGTGQFREYLYLCCSLPREWKIR